MLLSECIAPCGPFAGGGTVRWSGSSFIQHAHVPPLHLDRLKLPPPHDKSLTIRGSGILDGPVN